MLRKRVFLKTLQISQKKPVSESLFDKIAGLKAIFQEHLFWKTLQTTASVISKITVNHRENGFTITMELNYSFML